MAYPNTLNVVGNGCFLDPLRLVEAIESAKSKGVEISPKNLRISKTAHLVLPAHKQKDEKRESGEKSQGSTKAGIAFTAADKALREGVRAEIIEQPDELEKIGDEQFVSAARQLKDYLSDSVELIQEAIAQDKGVLLEGAQAFGLDINHGKYPFVTSSDTTVSGLMSGSGINYKQVGRVIGVAKATPSKVGGGPFVTKITDPQVAEQTRGQKGRVDSEFGATTGREREVGYLDLVALKRAIEVNGVDAIALTKFDCVNRHGDTTKIAIAYELNGEKITNPPSTSTELYACKPVYEELPTWQNDTSAEAENYLKFIEDYLKVRVTMVGNGPGRNQLIVRSR